MLPSEPNMILIVVGGGALLGAVAAGVWLLMQWMTAKQTVDWLVAHGQITESEVQQTTTRSGQIQYHAHVEYIYKVTGKEYTGNRIKYLSRTGPQVETAERLIKPYPVGQPVSVYYSPGNPRECVLEAGYDMAMIAPQLGLMIGLFVVGVYCWVRVAAG